MSRAAWGLVASLAAGVLAAAPAVAKTYKVTKSGDPPSAPCTKNSCTLRAALDEANAKDGADVIELRGGRVHTLEVEGDEDLNVGGDLDVLDQVTVRATGPKRAVVDADGIDRAFDIRNLTAATRLEGLVIRHGQSGLDDGGAILAGGPLTLVDSVVTHNDAGVLDAAIHVSAPLTLKRTRVLKSGYLNGGGGITAEGFGGLTIVRSTIANSEGHGILTADNNEATIMRSRITGNAGGTGGGVIARGDTEVIHTDITRNVSGNYAGGIDGGSLEPCCESLVVVDSTISHNRAGGDGGIGDDGANGALGELSVVGSRVADNVSTGNGVGGIAKGSGNGFEVKDSLIAHNKGWGITARLTDASIDRSTILDNRGASGGGVWFTSAIDARITRSTIADNRGTSEFGGGGGVATWPGGETIIEDSTLVGNRSEGDGGAIENRGHLELTNTTIVGNRADIYGGGIVNLGTAILRNVTVARNRADADDAGGGSGGGIAWVDGDNFQVRNSLIALNRAGDTGSGPDCFGIEPFPAGDPTDVSLLGKPGGCQGFPEPPNLVGVNPKLGKLAANGGPTKTIALKAGSPAVNAAGPASPAEDQRGVKRKNPDIGAFERR